VSTTNTRRVEREVSDRGAKAEQTKVRGDERTGVLPDLKSDETDEASGSSEDERDIGVSSSGSSD